jgi:phosphohistidine phosphatase
MWMDLILWRHADALPADDDDHSRKLSGKGRKQAALTAAWLDRQLPDGAKIICSPATRTVETAEALSIKYGRKMSIKPEIGLGADPTQVLIAAGWPDNRHPIVIVGHQPVLGMVASFLLFGQPQNLTFRKSAVWWLTNRGREERSEHGEKAEPLSVVLRAAVCPEFL